MHNHNNNIYPNNIPYNSSYNYQNILPLQHQNSDSHTKKKIGYMDCINNCIKNSDHRSLYYRVMIYGPLSIFTLYFLIYILIYIFNYDITKIENSYFIISLIFIFIIMQIVLFYLLRDKKYEITMALIDFILTIIFMVYSIMTFQQIQKN
jgi:hypothetical protein